MIWPWVLLLGLTVAALGGGLYVQAFKRPKNIDPRVTLENYNHLRVGLTEAQVRRILGSASRRDDSIVPKLGNLNHRYKVEDVHFPQRCFWEEGEDFIWVTFVEGQVKQFGATLDGVRLGDEIKSSLVLETQVKDE